MKKLIAAAAALAMFASPAIAVELTGAGATVPAPFYFVWTQQYRADHKDARTQYDAVGSGAGVKEFVAGKVDFGASDATMTDARIAKVKAGVVLVPATAGAVAVACNLPDSTTCRCRRASVSDRARWSIKCSNAIGSLAYRTADACTHSSLGSRS